MSNKCIIIDCNSIEPGNTLLYGFPKDNRMKEKWSQAILNETGQNSFSENDVICSKHFSPNSFTTAESQDEIILKPNAVPFTNDGEPFTKRIKIESEHVGNSEENQNNICINTAKENLTRSDNETLAISNGDTGGGDDNNDDDDDDADADFNNSDLNDNSDNSEDDYNDDNDSTYTPEIDWIQQQMQEQKVYFKEISDALKDVAQNLKEQTKMMQRSLELREKQVELLQKDFEEKQKYRKERLRLMQEEVNIERASLQLRLRQTINAEVEEDVEE